MDGISHLSITEESLESVRKNLQELFDMGIKSDLVLRQVILSCLSPLVVGGEDNLGERLGSVNKDLAKREFQAMLNYHTKKYVGEMLSKLNDSLDTGEYTQITRASSPILETTFIVSEAEAFGKEFEFEPEQFNSPKKKLMEVSYYEKEFDFDLESIKNARVPKGAVSAPIELSSHTDTLELGGESGERGLGDLYSMALDGSRFSDEASGDVPDFDFDDFDLD